jgi:hypothetical protein
MDTSRKRFSRAWRLLAILALVLMHLSTVPIAQAAEQTSSIFVPDGDVAALIAAINTANGTGSVIELEPNGTYTLTAAWPIISPDVFPPTSPLTIIGNGATIQRSDADGTREFRIFHVAPGGILNLHDLTVSNGYVTGAVGGRGGGINNAGTLTMTNSTVSGNRGHFGGGIYNTGTMTMTNSTLSANRGANSGGAISNSGGTVEMTDSTVSDNTSGYGGGIRNSATLTMTNSTVSDNRSTFDGGGIEVSSGTLEMVDSTVSNNIAGDGGIGDGGGIRNRGVTTLTNSTVSGNTARDGAGLHSTGGSAHVRLIDSTLSDNNAFRWGGGILNYHGTLEMINSVVSKNNALIRGGIFSANSGTLKMANSIVSDNTGSGISNFATLEITDSIVSNNTANQAGGIYNNGTLTLINSTVSGNRAVGVGHGDGGGGISTLHDGTVTLINSTVSDNEAAKTGGGIDIRGSGAAVTLANSLVALNSAPSGPDVSGAITDGGHNLLGNGSGSSGLIPGENGNLVGSTEYQIDPMLGPLQDNDGPTETMALLPGSPAIDAGNDANAPDTDQRGVPRPQGIRSDIGAFELEQDAPVQPPTQPGIPALDGFTSPNQGAFALAWTEADGEGDLTYTLQGKRTDIAGQEFATVADGLEQPSYAFAADQPDEGIWVYRVRASIGDLHSDYSDQSAEIIVDRTAPEITLITPTDGATYTLNEEVRANYSAEDIGHAGLDTVVGTVANDSAIDTATVGPKTFTVTATDKAGNQAQVTITYQVKEALPGETPEQQLQTLIDDVQEMPIHQGTKNSLSKSLENAHAALERGNLNQASRQLDAFIKQVEAQRDKRLTQEQADELVQAAEAILDALES